MILPDVKGFLAGKHKPQDNDERLALLGICQFKDLRRAAAGLYAAAFQADPTLAEDLQAGHRYAAARCAALTGSGGGADGAPVDSDERARWRQQACAWLRADLEAWSSKRADRAQAQRALSRWRSDPELAVMRDREALAKMPLAERQQWLALWRDVDALSAVQEDGGRNRTARNP